MSSYEQAMEKLGHKLAAERGWKVAPGSTFEFECSIDGYESTGYSTSISLLMRRPGWTTYTLREWGGWDFHDLLRELFDAEDYTTSA